MTNFIGKCADCGKGPTKLIGLMKGSHVGTFYSKNKIVEVVSSKDLPFKTKKVCEDCAKNYD